MKSAALFVSVFTLILTLACGGGGGTSTPTPLPSPTISSFSSDRTELTAGDPVILTAVFQNGAGTISPLVGAVASGVPTSVRPSADTTFQLIVKNDNGTSAQRNLSIRVVTAPQKPTITAPTSVPPGQSGFTASVSDQPGCTLSWHIENGSITAGQSSSRILFTSGVAGSLHISCTSTNALGVSATSNLKDISVATVVPPLARTGGIFCQSQAFVGQKGLLASLPISPSRTYAWLLPGGIPTSRLDQQVLSYDAGNIPGTTSLYASFQDPGGLPFQTSRTIQWVGDAFLKRPTEALPRNNFSAVILLDGRVLVCGGLPAFGGTTSMPPLASAELYDPITGTWAATGPMLRARRGHTATLLPDGRVLVAGGGADTFFFDSTYQPLADCEIYDPATGAWSIAAPMNRPRFLHSATLLDNGLVLVAGGQDQYAKEAEQYDPTSDHWTTVAPLLVGRKGHAATLLADGRVLVSGGDAQGLVTTRCEIYSPASDIWNETGAMAEGRRVHVSMRLPGGRILVAGGASNGAAAFGLTSCEVFDPATHTWVPTSSLPDGYEGPRACSLTDGSVLLLGTSRSNRTNLLRYNPNVGDWSFVGESYYDRSLGAVLALPDGQALLLGGSGTATFSERWDPQTGTLMRPTAMLAARGASGVFRLHDATWLLTEGHGTLPDGSNVECERYNPATDEWTPTGPMNQVGRTSYGRAVLADGSVLAAGGFGSYSFGSAGPLRTVERYNPATSRWYEAAPMTMWRYGNPGVLLPDGRFLMAGNEVIPYGVESSPWTYFMPSFGEIYDPVTDGWVSTHPMSAQRSGFGLVPLPGGRVLAAGGATSIDGNGGARTQATSEIYDPARNTWAVTGGMNQAREQFTTVALADGRVLVTGGLWRSGRLLTLASTEVYDPRTGIWSTVSPMSRPRAYASGILLTDGRILIAGGMSDVYGLTAETSAEIYDPTTDKWTPAGEMPTPSLTPTIAPLDDGRWLVLGQSSTLTTFFKPRP